jgi:hypothetical protein
MPDGITGLGQRVAPALHQCSRLLEVAAHRGQSAQRPLRGRLDEEAACVGEQPTNLRLGFYDWCRPVRVGRDEQAAGLLGEQQVARPLGIRESVAVSGDRRSGPAVRPFDVALCGCRVRDACLVAEPLERRTGLRNLLAPGFERTGAAEGGVPRADDCGVRDRLFVAGCLELLDRMQDIVEAPELEECLAELWQQREADEISRREQIRGALQDSCSRTVVAAGDSSQARGP